MTNRRITNNGARHAELRMFIKETESKHLRTESDTIANPNALFAWNLVREFANLEILRPKDLNQFCETHKKYHKLDTDYGCVHSTVKEKLTDKGLEKFRLMTTKLKKLSDSDKDRYKELLPIIEELGIN